MRFIGTFFQTVDAKGRVALPARFRRLLPQDQHSLILTIGREDCLLLYPLSEWSELTKSIEEMPRGPARRDAIRSISDHTIEVDLDANGRMTIPREFLKKLQVDREVAVVGGLRYIEIWHRNQYEAGTPERREVAKEILDQLF